MCHLLRSGLGTGHAEVACLTGMVVFRFLGIHVLELGEQTHLLELNLPTPESCSKPGSAANCLATLKNDGSLASDGACLC